MMRDWFEKVREIHRSEAVLARICRDAPTPDVEEAAVRARLELLVAAQHEIAEALARVAALARRMG